MIFILMKICGLYNNCKTLIFNKALLIGNLRYENESAVSQEVRKFFFHGAKKKETSNRTAKLTTVRKETLFNINFAFNLKDLI